MTVSRESSPPASQPPRRAEFLSISGQSETMEPPATTDTSSTATTGRTAQNNPSLPPPTSSSSSITPAVPSGPTRTTSSSHLAATTSPLAGISPRTSRNTSPSRKDKPQPLAGGLSTQPSAAAIQRALSASAVPNLHTGSITEAVSRLPRGQRNGSASGEGTSQWPVSPRLNSPPPSSNNSRRRSSTTQAKKSGDASPAAVPGVAVQSPTTQERPAVPTGVKPANGETSPQKSEPQPVQQPKGPLRAQTNGKPVLETVQENSIDSVTEPSPAAKQAAIHLKPLTKIDDGGSRRRDDGDKTEEDDMDDDHTTAPIDSGSESAGAKSDIGPSRRTRADTPSSRVYRTLTAGSKPTSASSPAPPLAKLRQAEAKPNMTVETETVQSIPHSALTTSDRYDNNGSMKGKPSSETMRSRKDRKKVERKQRNINQGTGECLAEKLCCFPQRLQSQLISNWSSL